MAKLYTLLCMLLLAQVATAQTPVPTSTPLSWPPDPNAIFADGVQWEVVPPTPEPATETPFISPTIDPERPRVCDGASAQAAQGEGSWIVIYRDNQDRQGYLCNTETGEQRDTLPSTHEHRRWTTYSTPDDTKVILMDGYQVYVYQQEHETYLLLGTLKSITHDSEVWFCGFVSDTQGVICDFAGQRRSYIPEKYYIFDMTQPNSVKFAFEGWNKDTFYEEDLKRYISVYSHMYAGQIYGTGAEHIPCRITVYDALGLREKELGYDCLPVSDGETITPFYRHGDYLYYLVVDDDKTSFTRLHRYSIIEETVTQINPNSFGFEIEGIIGISPNEQYIVVLMDNDFERDEMWRQCCRVYDTSWQVAIIEIETGDFFYITDDIGVYIPDQLTWLDDTTLVMDVSRSYSELYVSAQGIISTEKPDAIWRIALPDQTELENMPAWKQPIEISIKLEYSVDLWSPGGDYGFVEYGTLIDLHTFDLLTLLHSSPLPYDLDFEWESDHALLVRVSSRDDDQSSITYRVLLP